MRAVVSFVLFAVGLILVLGGLYLVTLGGSLFYSGAGIALIVTSVLIWLRDPRARIVYALFLIVLAAWSLWEAGPDWWALAARMGMFLVFALLLLLPLHLRGRRFGPGWIGLFVVTGITGLGLLGTTLLPDPHDIAGQLPAENANPDAATGDDDPESWTAYGRNNYGQRFSPLEQITANNVDQLQPAWTYRTGDVKGQDDVGEFTYQATPIKIGDTLYLCTPHNWAVALDADTGAEKWVYKPDIETDLNRQHQTCRGLSYWPGENEASAPQQNTCSQRLFLPTSDARLLALDPETGELCADFAENGALDLMHNMPFRQSGYYYSTSPPVVAGNTIVIGGAVNDNYDIDSPSGVIRAYDVGDGKLLWNWDSGNPTETAPLDPDDPDQKYSTSSPNSWSIASADPELGLVYLPMGNRTPDQLGKYRSEAEETYATSVTALDLETGQPRWVHQFVHHDLWDMDTPAQPSLVDLDLPDGRVPALVVPTKQGDVYVLNRETGEAVLPVTERPAPQGAIPDDFTAATQPASALSFEPEPLTEAGMWGATAIDQMLCRIAFRKLRYEGRYTPPSLQGSIVYPGNFGAFNWGGIAVDPRRQVMFGMPLQLAFVSKLIPKDSLSADTRTNVGEQGVNSNEGADYAVQMGPFLSPLGIPCQQPPWGFVAGADLRSGEILWRHRNGTSRDMTPVPLELKLGMPGIGGPVITGSGVVFMAATIDNYLRAYDLTTGAEIWRSRLPAGGQATPMTYLDSEGRQMVVQVAGGHGSVGTKLGDYVMAWRLSQ
ncbi:membrane-bound PQQ-dependent dehydrogenase, glucose/quinate/shikimate family [Paracoccus onubensis]|uniref:membrane-bound PQQ-dependent dehydrogenase, glucose/quinate/shikimate family n=1 Tax=Paracoccus onubensis TaxID=1675788 RepID=UPI002731DECB|nr:membrane-bound PQQ-dependent dehydrogenase, glucose/quinate/shikimate family [Paracoccus onubensis]MDP0926930.1 membrane-bound PQQ-dependent dehydrogenase, glucose/quinate/shikimate family [Paracoccus onubensis]